LFKETDYIDIIKTFEGEKVIYLVDMNHKEDNKLFAIRVYFYFLAEE